MTNVYVGFRYVPLFVVCGITQKDMKPSVL